MPQFSSGNGRNRPALPKKQQHLLDFLESWLRSNPVTPSASEIAKMLSFNSAGSVYGCLKALEKKGYVRRDPSCPRLIQLLPPPKSRLSKNEIPVKAVYAGGKFTPIAKPITIQISKDFKILPSKFFFVLLQQDVTEDWCSLHANVGILFQKVVIASEGDTVLARMPNGKLFVAMCVMDPESNILVLKSLENYDTVIENCNKYVLGIAVACVRRT